MNLVNEMKTNEKHDTLVRWPCASKNLLPLPAELGPCLQEAKAISFPRNVQPLHHVKKSFLGKQAQNNPPKMCKKEVRNSETD